MAKKEEKVLKSTDVILKQYWADNERFADLFNAVYFQGQPVLKPEELEDTDAVSDNVISLKHVTMTISRIRDVIKKQVNGVQLALYAIENQQKVHYAMPLRIRLNDDLSYVKQCESLKREHKHNKDPMTSEEFLSGIKKEDRLIPVLTIVLYYGEQEWDGPVKLSDMMEMPEFFKPLFQDYNITLLQIAKDNHYPFQNQEVKLFFQIIRELYGDISAKEFGERYRNQKLDEEILRAVGAVCGAKELIDLAERNEGESDMSKKIRLIEECREAGREETRKDIALIMLRKSYPEEEIIDISQISKEELERLKKEVF